MTPAPITMIRMEPFVLSAFQFVIPAERLRAPGSTAASHVRLLSGPLGQERPWARGDDLGDVSGAMPTSPRVLGRVATRLAWDADRAEKVCHPDVHAKPGLLGLPSRRNDHGCRRVGARQCRAHNRL